MQTQEWGDPAAPAAVLAHGAGSTAAFVARVFATPLADVGYRLVSWDSRADDPTDELAAVVAATHAQLVGGISLGAHTALRWAAATPGAAPAGLVVALVGWLGPPGPTARLTADAAEEIARDGLATVLARLHRDATGWVAAELADAWSRWDEADLVRVLRATANSAGPSPGELARIGAPVGVAALDADPYHPAQAARDWAARLPLAAVEVVPVAAPGTDRSVLGAAAVSAWRRAGGAPVSAPR